MKQNAILITADYLGPGYLGPYGNTWIETPGLNRFASHSILYEFALAGSPDLAHFTSSVQSGKHAPSAVNAQPDEDPARPGQDFGLWARLRRKGIESRLISDSAALCDTPQLSWMEERLQVVAESDGLAPTIEQTRCFQTFANGLGVLSTQTEGGFCWIHFAGMGQVWDAPLEYREAFHDEEDPPIYEGTEVPELVLDADSDPDESFPLTMAYAAQVRLFDECLAFFLDQLEGMAEWRDSLVIISSPRGMALGEHGRLGPLTNGLHGESVRIPLLVRPPGNGAGTRCRRLVQPEHIGHTLWNWLSPTDTEPLAGGSRAFDLLSPPAQLESSQHDVAICKTGRASAIRTPAWYLLRFPNHRELYAKPDDQWEVNNVIDRCGTLPDELEELLDAYLAVLREDLPISQLPPLSHLAAKGFA